MNCGRDFLGNSVIRTLHFYCRSMGSILVEGSEIPQAARCRKTQQNCNKFNNLFEMIYHIARLKLTCLFWPIFWVILPLFFLERNPVNGSTVSLSFGVKACIPLVMTDTHCGNDRFISTWLPFLPVRLSRLSYRWYFSRWLKASLGYKKTSHLVSWWPRMPLSSLWTIHSSFIQQPVLCAGYMPS